MNRSIRVGPLQWQTDSPLQCIKSVVVQVASLACQA